MSIRCIARFLFLGGRQYVELKSISESVHLFCLTAQPAASPPNQGMSQGRVCLAVGSVPDCIANVICGFRDRQPCGDSTQSFLCSRAYSTRPTESRPATPSTARTARAGTILYLKIIVFVRRFPLFALEQITDNSYRRVFEASIFRHHHAFTYVVTGNCWRRAVLAGAAARRRCRIRIRTGSGAKSVPNNTVFRPVRVSLDGANRTQNASG